MSWFSNLNPTTWDVFQSNSNGLTSQNLAELNNLVTQQTNQMGPTNEIMRNNQWYIPYTLKDGTQLYQDHQGQWFNSQGDNVNLKSGLDGKIYSNDSLSSFADNFAKYGGLALQGIQALGNLYMGNKMYGLAKDQFRFQKDFANKNLANSMKTYNNALADRINSRYAFEGRSQAEADDYLKKHSL